MIISIDASRANKFNKTGTEWYSWHLIEALKIIANPDDKFLLYTNSALTGGLEKLPDNFVEKKLSWPLKYLWTQLRLWWELWCHPPEVLLVPAHTIPFLPLPKKIKVIVNVHDVGFKRFPQLYKKVQVWYHDLTMRRIKQRADLIITISEFSKREIIDLYQIQPNKIKVVYLGFDATQFSPAINDNSDLLKKYHINKPYLLYVGRLEKKKNIGNLLMAFALAKEVKPELKLVLVGNAGNQFEEIKKIINNYHLEQEVIITGYVAANDLPIIYNQTEIFLFPTLYEGFGLPILEAMASGVPVITSNFAPHNEIGGEAVYYINPHSPQQLFNAIINILEDKNLKESLINRGLIRVKNFSWQQTAQAIYQLIKKVD